MKVLRIYLMVMGGLFTLAILIGVGVWFLYQDLPGANPARYVEDPAALGGETKEPAPKAESPQSESEPAIYTITPDSLTPSQRTVLKTFGMGDSSFAVTQSMIDCAMRAVGTTRFNEILGGSAPSPLEAMSLLPCMKR